MRLPTKIEIALGVLLVLALAWIGFDQYRKAVATAVAEERAKMAQQADQKVAAATKARDEEWQKVSDKQLAEIANAKKDIASMIQYANQHTEAPKPIIHVGNPETVTLHTDDAVIPYQSAPAFFQAYADGQKCLTTDLPKVKADLGDWQQRYSLKDQESKEWEKAAKGGSWLKRLGRDALKVSIGIAVGYALHSKL